MASGYIYFALNSAMPGLTKIGVTKTSLTSRLSDLQGTGVPSEFSLAACFFVSDIKLCEQEVHKLLDNFRNSANREFFRISPREAIKLALPRLTSFLSDLSADSDVHPFPDLSEEEEEMIWAFLNKPKHVFWTTQDYINAAKVDDIDGKYLLGELSRKGYLKAKAMRRDDTHSWDLGHKGLAYVRWIR